MELEGAVKDMLSPAAIAMIAGVMVIWAGSHVFGVGFVADAVMLVSGVVFLGLEVWSIADDFSDYLSKTAAAETQQHLDEASNHLARIIVILGVEVFMVVIAKAGGRLAGMARKDGEVQLKPQDRKTDGLDEVVTDNTSIQNNDFNLNNSNNIQIEDFLGSVEEFEGQPDLLEESFELFLNGMWVELEALFNAENLNGGWPPNRGTISAAEVTLPPGQKIDRYGGFSDKDTGEFKDLGTFVAQAGEPFENRALPSDTLDKPYKQYEVLKEIPDVLAGEAIPWFGQPGKGLQFELPLSIDGLVSFGYIKEI